MIKILSAQHFREKIAAKLPAGIVVASKSGSVTAVSHDSGIVFLPGGRKYVVVLLSRGVQNEEAVNNTLASVSRILYDYVTTKN
jgi:beta-lactamase class A